MNFYVTVLSGLQFPWEMLFGSFRDFWPGDREDKIVLENTWVELLSFTWHVNIFYGYEMKEKTVVLSVMGEKLHNAASKLQKTRKDCNLNKRKATQVNILEIFFSKSAYFFWHWQLQSRNRFLTYITDDETTNETFLFCCR